MPPGLTPAPAIPDPALPEALVAVCDALLAAAWAGAEQILAHADERAREVLQQAQSHADQIRAASRDRDAAAAAELVAAQRSDAERQARGMVLAAEQVEYEALRDAARLAVAHLRDEPEYPGLRRRMAALVRRLLGDEAEVHDAAGGGVIATAAGRSVDLRLSRLADRAVDVVLAGAPPAGDRAEPPAGVHPADRPDESEVERGAATAGTRP